MLECFKIKMFNIISCYSGYEQFVEFVGYELQNNNNDNNNSYEQINVIQIEVQISIIQYSIITLFHHPQNLTNENLVHIN